MQVQSKKSEHAGDHKKVYRICGWTAIAIMVAAIIAILVATFIASPHYAAGNPGLVHICYHKAVHLCLLLR